MEISYIFVIQYNRFLVPFDKLDPYCATVMSEYTVRFTTPNIFSRINKTSKNLAIHMSHGDTPKSWDSHHGINYNSSGLLGLYHSQ